MSKLETHDPPDEVARVLCWRRREALAAGFTLKEANRYAESETSAQTLRQLVEMRCPKKLLVKIVL